METLLLLGHGSHLNPGSSEPVHEHARRIRRRGAFGEVAVAFWKEEPSFREVLRTVDGDRVYAVPFFMANGYFVDEVIPRELRLPVDRVTYTPPVGTHPSMTDVIVERALSSVDGGDGTALAVVGHGTERNPNSAASAREHVCRIRRRGVFDEVSAVFMDEPPYVDDVTQDFESDEVVVVPFFASDGYHTQEDIPEDIGIGEAGGDSDAVSATVDGKRISYTGAVGTDPSVADVVVERASEADEEAGDGDATSSYSDTGVRREAEKAFIEKVGEGEALEWGQLLITRADDGYCVRHVDDSEVSTSELVSYEEPREAEGVSRYDDDGEYRPTKSETTLPTGWIFESIDTDALVEVVRRFYPASIENSYLDEGDELDVTDWDETAERQTGIYAEVDSLDDDAVRRATHALCANGCAKRREWKVADDEEPSNNGDFPCREPCSLFVAGAREFLSQEEKDATVEVSKEDAEALLAALDGLPQEGGEETVELSVGDAEALLDALDEDEPRRGALGEEANEYRRRYTASKLKEVVW